MADVQYVCGATAVTDPPIDVTRRVRAACAEERVDVVVTGDIEKRETVAVGTDNEPKVVRIECTQGHWCDFPCTPVSGESRVVGVPVGSAEVTTWDGWRSHADPVKGLERIGRYATWVLTANASVTALAGTLAVGGAIKLEGTPATLIYAIAIIALGVSWAAVSLSIAPKWVRINRQSPSDFVKKLNAQYASRRFWLRVAAPALGLALLLAALVPLGGLFPAEPRPTSAITYEVKAAGEFTARLSGTGLPPNSVVDLLLQSAGSAGTQPIARGRSLVDDAGKGSASLTVDSVRAATRPLLLTGRWTSMDDGKLVPKQDTVRVP